MGWAASDRGLAPRATYRASSPASEKVTYEFNDYSEGLNSFISNDKIPLVNGSVNQWRLAQDARIITLGSTKTRKGFDFYSQAAGLTIDKSITSTTGAATQNFSTTTWLAQTFTASQNGALTQFDINLNNANSALGTPLISLYTDNSGVPGTLIATSSVAASTLTNSYAYYSFYFASAPTVLSGTSYWIVASIQPVGSGSYNWSSTTSVTTAKVSTNSGVSWSTTSYSLNFKQYYATIGGSKGMYRGYKSDGSKVTLLAHNTTLYSVNDVTGALTAIKTGLSASATKYRFTKVNDIIYYVNGFDGYRKWDFTTESQVNSTNYSLICSHKGLIFLQRVDDPNRLDFTNFGLYEIFTSTDFIYADAPKTGDSTTALVSLNGLLLIFTQNSKFILSGSNNSTFSVDAAPDRKGTYTQETVTQDDNFVYYLSDDGVYKSNGSEAQIISNNIYQEVLTLQNKGSACLCRNKGRLYMWYPSAGSSSNDSCYVWNINFSSQGAGETVESKDTGAYVSCAVNAFGDNDSMLVASSLVGQVYWQELDSNDYNNLGGPINFILQTPYLVFSIRLHYQYLGGPGVLKQTPFWNVRFGAQSGNYTVNCQYAYDERDNWQTIASPNTQGTGAIWGSGITWGNFTWGSTAEVQEYLIIPGEYRRIAVRLTHSATRQPSEFLGHTMVVEYRRIQ